MAYDFYQSAALILRYGFTAAGLFIAGRGMYMTVRDGQRARLLRADAKETGAIAVLDVITPDGDTRKVPIGREGVAGAGRSCDARIGHAGLAKRHFVYQFVNGCLRVIALDDSEIRTTDGELLPALLLRPGDCFMAGKTRFCFHVMRVRNSPLSPAAKKAYGSTLHRALSHPDGGERRAHGED